MERHGLAVSPEALCTAARHAATFAYAPYSKYHVGAALLGKSGRVYSGCNVENASYGLTNCAERTAIFKAVSEGETAFDAIAIAAGDPASLPYPCGACRQVMAQFFDGDTPVYIVPLEGELTMRSFLFDQLLPHRFTL